LKVPSSCVHHAQSPSLTNPLTLVAVCSCGQIFCKKCVDQFIAPGKECLASNKPCKARNLVRMEKGGIGFSGHDENLEATSFKHVRPHVCSRSELAWDSHVPRQSYIYRMDTGSLEFLVILLCSLFSVAQAKLHLKVL